MTIESLSDTKLQAVGKSLKHRDPDPEPVDLDAQLPRIAYLTMAVDPINTRHAILNAVDQDYPDHLKTLYLLHQEPFTPGIKHDLPIKIKEIDVKGTWPALWFWKLIAFTRIAREHLTIIFDEDDRFSRFYTREAIEALLRDSRRGVYNRRQLIVNRKSIKVGKYKPFWGTLVIRTKDLKEMVELFAKLHTDGINHAPRGRKVPLDGPFCSFLNEKLGPGSLGTHRGKRYYFNHSKSNSQLNGHARPEESIDETNN